MIDAAKAANETPFPPDPVREHPPADRYCDLVLNGGVASGVVYPWALVELARHYRFKNIGGNSVGAMAAAVAAAAEYGRCHGVDNAFEPLRRFPLDLAEVESGQTKMLRLFQPSPGVRRLFALFLAAVSWSDGTPGFAPPPRDSLFVKVLGIYGLWLPLTLLLLLTAGALWQAWGGGLAVWLLAAPAVLGALAVAGGIGALRFYADLCALARNGYGMCTGRSQLPGQEALVEWLHRGVQLSAGRHEHAAPLTFADLWAAPRFGQAGPSPLPGGLEPKDCGINLQMFTSNVTQGRPVRLPLNDANTRLYYLPKEWEKYFPEYLMVALERASTPYRPLSASDPDPARCTPAQEAERLLMTQLRELPSGGMPIVVAARLSLCFPLLFSSVPVYAVDYEAPVEKRSLRKCLLLDGGLCTNFPVHLFDAAHPKWPTFALMLDKRLRNYKNQALWLPRFNLEGRADNWLRFVPGAGNREVPDPPLPMRLIGFVGGIILTMKDWNDRVTGRLPQVRNRTIRFQLREGEGQLNIAMPRERILQMAHNYGTAAGKILVKRFLPDRHGAKAAWREHLYVRAMIEIRSLRKHLRGYGQAVRSRSSTVPLREILADAMNKRPLAECPGKSDPCGSILTKDECGALDRAVQAIEVMEIALANCESHFGPYQSLPEPEMRLRPPL